jgi:stearoyl-CoA desaturase (Delta-9 desaturase)
MTQENTLNSVINAVPSNSINTSNVTRNFAILTVGTTTLGALVTAYQAFTGQVGIIEIALLLIFYFPTALGVEAGFHRYFSHSAFRGGPFTTWLFGILGSMAAQGPVLFWAATHRKHHSFTDQSEDPHSPNIHGSNLAGRIKRFIYAHVGWLFEPPSAGWAKYAPDLLRKREVLAINQSYLLWVLLGLALPAMLGGLLHGSWSGVFNGLVWGGLLRIFLLDHVTWSINSFGHLVGRRPHTTTDNSRNIWLLAIPSAGGSWHNNHHAYPIGARNDHQSVFQVDLSGMFIELLGVVGLADNIKRYNRKPTQEEPHDSTNRTST